MIRFAVLLVAAFVAGISAPAYAETPQIFLPPNAKNVNIVGNNFQLLVTQLDTIKDNWVEVAEETAAVETPRKKDEEHGVVNTNLREQISKQQSVVQELGPLNDELQQWIENRATELCDKIDRFENELMEKTKVEQRIVVLVLLLNTLVDLENLIKENIKSMRWVKNKLKSKKESKVIYAREVEEWLKAKIDENKAIELKIRGSNEPGDKWLINTQALKRILYEQKFSEDISYMIVYFLGGNFNMMQRFRVYDLHRSDRKRFEDGLYYKAAKGHIPAHFPFSAQEAMANGY